MSYQRSWKAMKTEYFKRLLEQTGEDVASWNQRILNEAPDDEAGLRDWLNERGVHGYIQMLVVLERFGYPDYLQTPDEELIDNQYADRPHLKPIFDRLISIVQTRHPEVEVVGRKTYVPLYTPKHQFAIVKATTRKRVDLGLRLDGHEPSGRLIQAKSLGNETINLRIPLESIEGVDDDVEACLDLAWRENT